MNIELEYNKYKNYINKIVNRILWKYNAQDELKSIGYIALWKALSNFDETKNVSFINYLGLHVTWETISRKKQLQSKEVNNIELVQSYNDIDNINLVLDGLTDEESTLLKEWFIYKYSKKELAKKYNVSSEWIRVKIKRALEKANALNK